jgi:outer membrane protein
MRILLFLGVLFLCGMHAQAQVLTLNDAIVHALQHSPEIEAAQAEVAFAQARHAQARASRFATEFEARTAHSVAPAISVPAGFTGPDYNVFLQPEAFNDYARLGPFNRIEVSLLQPLLTWGELGGNLRAAEAGTNLEIARVDQQRRVVAQRVAETWYAVLLARQLEALTREAGSILEQATREIERLLEEGDESVSLADQYQLRLTEQEFQRRIVEVQERLRTAEVAFLRQLGLPTESTPTLADSTLIPLTLELLPLERYQERALALRPELRQAEAGIAARRALVEVARSDFYPKLGLGVSFAFAYAPNRFRPRSPYLGDPFLARSVRPGIGFQQKLNFGITRARVQQAEAQLNAVRAQRDGAGQLIAFEVEEAWRNVRVAQAAMTSLEASYAITRQWLLDEQLAFDLELGSAQNLVRAVQARLTTEASYYESIQRYNTSVLRLLSTSGMLTGTVFGE